MTRLTQICAQLLSGANLENGQKRQNGDKQSESVSNAVQAFDSWPRVVTKAGCHQMQEYRLL